MTMTSRLSPILLSMLVGYVCPACVIDDIDISGRRCPCPLEGWECDTSIDRCVERRADAGDASSPDSGTDSGIDGGRDSGRDGGIDAGPPPPYCETVPDAIFCDDFELGNLSRWDDAPDPASAFTTTGAASTGAKGLHMMSSGPVPIGLIASLDATDAIDLWFRASVHIRAGSTGTLDLFELSAGDAGSITASFAPGANVFVLDVAASGSSIASAQSREGPPIPDGWVCVRAHVVRGVNGLVELFADSGPSEVEISMVTTDFGVSFDHFSLALAPGSDVDLDDVVWATTDPRCSPSPLP